MSARSHTCVRVGVALFTMSDWGRSVKSEPREDLLDSVVSDVHLACISKELKNWEELAPYLGLTEVDEDEIREDYRGQYGLQKRAALRRWSRANDSDSTYRNLITALCCVQNLQLVDRIKAILLEKEPLLETFRHFLLERYKQTPHPGCEQWPTCMNKKIMPSYVDITLLKVPLDASEVTSEVGLHEILFDASGIGRQVVLVEGPPGSGKTTLTWHISQQWAEGELFQQFSLLILMSFAKANSAFLNATCLADVIPHENKETCDSVAKLIARRNGKEVCFIVDSWNEAPCKSYIHQLIESSELPQCTVIVMSRPVVSGMLSQLATTKLCITGFSQPKIRDFINISLNSEREHLMQILQEKPTLNSLCQLPLITTIIVHLYTVSPDIFLSDPELYKALIFNQLVRHRQLYTQDGEDMCEVSDIDCLPEEMAVQFRALCKLAYIGVRDSHSTFDLETMRDFGLTPSGESFPDFLSLMLVQKQGEQHAFTFQNHTMQKYLAEYYTAHV